MRRLACTVVIFVGIVVNGESRAKITVILSIEVRTDSLMPAQHILSIHVIFLHNYRAS